MRMKCLKFSNTLQDVIWNSSAFPGLVKMFEIQECLKSVQTMFETTKIGIKVPWVPEVVSYLILIVRVECFIKPFHVRYF